MITKKTDNNSLLTSALILSLGGFIAKLLGAIYRIPLTNLLGSYGMGLYQLVFPLYSLLLTISSAGIPSAISKLIAEKIQLNKRQEAKAVFKWALLLLVILGAIGSLLLFVFAGFIAKLQGNMDTITAYRLISPSVLLVCVISAYRGYFQGRLNMVPTAISQIVEQVVKLTLGLILIIANKEDIYKGVNYAILAVTVSEAVALAILYIQYKLRRDKATADSSVKFGQTAKNIFKLAIPITLCGAIIPLTQLIDSVLVVNLIKSNATQLYGLFSGPVHSLLNLPVVLTLGVATACIPSIAKSNISGDVNILNVKINSAFKLTFLMALPCSVGLILFSQPIVRLLYGSLPMEEIIICSKLLQVSGIGVLFLSVLQTSTAILQAVDRVFAPLLFLAVATAVKITLNVILLPIPNLNIFGGAISSVICYMVASVADLLYIIIKYKQKLNIAMVVIKPVVATAIMSVAITAFNYFFADFTNTIVGVLVAVCVCGIVFVGASLAIKALDADELAMIKKTFHIRGKKKE